MKKINLLRRSVLLLITISLVLMGCQDDEGQLEIQENIELVNFKSTPIEGQYIITLYGQSSVKQANLKYSQSKEALNNEILSKFSNIQLSKESIVHTYGYAINGFTAKLNDNQLQTLKKDSRIKLIEQDQLVTLAKPSWAGGGDDEPTSQEVPWGIDRVNGGVTYSDTLVAWVIDTGIDLTHPDLNVDVNRSASFLGGKDADDPNDANGHGTHVAGTIAAIDNSEGVIGVAAGATVISVRVLDRRGSGTYSGVIAGVDYVGANGESGDVANMSLGGGISQSLDDAVIAASNKGIIFCLAAGNSSDDANNYSPARANGSNIVTVSASDINNVFANFSNYGNPPIDWCAPGVSIKSTWKKGGYNTISGTSMATPHVAGVLLLGTGYKLMDVIDDPDGDADDIITH
ncbi:S8 family peptidase [Flavobacteriaceae bacterium AH-315-B10]|nr:S8 family peptidase [Flavobacteriaceae bacterium AH-315-B10]